MKERLLAVLQRHKGPDNPITMVQLIKPIFGEWPIPLRQYDQSRIIRSLVQQLEREGVPVVARNSKDGGYYLATSDEQIDRRARWFRKRAMTALRREARLRKMSVEQMIEQKPLDFSTQTGDENAT